MNYEIWKRISEADAQKDKTRPEERDALSKLVTAFNEKSEKGCWEYEALFVRLSFPIRKTNDQLGLDWFECAKLLKYLSESCIMDRDGREGKSPVQKIIYQDLSLGKFRDFCEETNVISSLNMAKEC